MPYTTTTLKTNAEAIITALPANGTVTAKELMIAYKAAQGLNCSNYATLESKIQYLIDNQTTSTPDAEVMLAAIMVGSVQARTYTYYQTVSVSSSVNQAVPANAVSCLVSCTAGSSNAHGGSVIEYEIGVTANSTLNVVRGTGQSGSHVIGSLQINSGSASGTVVDAGQIQPTSLSTVTTSGVLSTNASDITLKFLIEEIIS